MDAATYDQMPSALSLALNDASFETKQARRHRRADPHVGVRQNFGRLWFGAVSSNLMLRSLAIIQRPCEPCRVQNRRRQTCAKSRIC